MTLFRWIMPRRLNYHFAQSITHLSASPGTITLSTESSYKLNVDIACSSCSMKSFVLFRTVIGSIREFTISVIGSSFWFWRFSSKYQSSGLSRPSVIIWREWVDLNIFSKYLISLRRGIFGEEIIFSAQNLILDEQWFVSLKLFDLFHMLERIFPAINRVTFTKTLIGLSTHPSELLNTGLVM